MDRRDAIKFGFVSSAVAASTLYAQANENVQTQGKKIAVHKEL